MSKSARANFDGRQVILDEPPPFEPGAALVIRVGAAPDGPLHEQTLAELAALQGIRPCRDFAELVSGLNHLAEDEADLWDIIVRERAERREAAAAKTDPDV